jgi:hypothetical protein
LCLHILQNKTHQFFLLQNLLVPVRSAANHTANHCTTTTITTAAAATTTTNYRHCDVAAGIGDGSACEARRLFSMRAMACPAQIAWN